MIRFVDGLMYLRTEVFSSLRPNVQNADFQLVGDLGPLGIVFNTPSHHRVHHGRNPYCIDRNYGGVFIIWDKMFGTFEAERKDDPPVYGLVHNENTFNQIYLQVHVLWDMLYFKGQMKNGKGESLFPGIVNKIKAALYPPGWFPGVKVTPFFHWMSLVDTSYGVPQPEKPVVKYNPPLDFWVKLYLGGHFTLLLAIFLHFEYDRAKLDYIGFALKVAFFLVTMQTFGAFFDKRWYAPHLEIARCSGVLAFFGFLLFDHIGVAPHRIFLITVHGMSGILWIGYVIQEVISLDERPHVRAATTTAKPSTMPGAIHLKL
ncbi:unnamed protein product [Angiostrongylus costaricensis]|uniref:Alkylglycerol monooxygenase n=1 Tax=Angiostrongylus costaricensis TaxID=334426 RepID=A0A158PES7_ANGCS|nr:unnamed protein product [Angiostrongylus costaricensis]